MDRVGLAQKQQSNQVHQHYLGQKLAPLGRGWHLEVYGEIRQLYNLRNQAIHGDPVLIGTQEARRPHEICAKSLKAELGIMENLRWEHEPKLPGLSLEYELLRSSQ